MMTTAERKAAGPIWLRTVMIQSLSISHKLIIFLNISPSCRFLHSVFFILLVKILYALFLLVLGIKFLPNEFNLLTILHDQRILTNTLGNRSLLRASVDPISRTLSHLRKNHTFSLTRRGLLRCYRCRSQR